jgi:transcriptional regulator with XRE-family HTH domain
MATANHGQGSGSPADESDTAGETVRDRLQRLRAGTEKPPPPEPEEPATRPPRVTRREPRRRVRERKRTAALREPSPPPVDQERTALREPEAPAAAPEAPSAGQPAARTGPEEGGAPAEVVSERLAARLAALRAERGWSLQDLARRTGVSRSNLSRIERGEISPTADVLVRLAAAYDQTLSGLMAEVESQPCSLVRAAEQAVTGEDVWRRRVVSPPYPGLAGSIIDAQLLPGGDVTYDPPLPGAEQHLWLITGSLEVTLGSPPSGQASAAGGSDDDPEVRAEKEGDFVLIRGDCLRLRLWGPARLRCLSPDPARYALFTVTPAPSP